MSSRGRRERDIPYKVRFEDIRVAVCQDPHRCTHAKALAPVLASKFGAIAAETVKVDLGISDELGEDDYVVVAWDGDDGRHYNGLVSGNVARHILMLTDAGKDDLLKQFRNRYHNGASLVLTEVESRNKQHQPPAPVSRDPEAIARRAGYAKGRRHDPDVALEEFSSTEEFSAYTEDQREQFMEGFAVGRVKGPQYKAPARRKPRVSAKNRGRFGLIPDAQEPEH